MMMDATLRFWTFDIIVLQEVQRSNHSALVQAGNCDYKGSVAVVA